MRFAISIPQYARDSRFDDDAFRGYLRRVEELGLFESVWVQEQVIGAGGSLAPLETLAYVAACTEQVRLGCAVFVLPLHNPLHLAKAISSLDCLSHGRVEVGVATGGRGRPFDAFGVDADRPVARFNEALALMKACWTEREINFDGQLWKLQGASMEPKPVQKPYPPVWFGGSAPAGMRRAVRHGDGFMGAGSQTTGSVRRTGQGGEGGAAARRAASPTRSGSASASTSTSRTTRCAGASDSRTRSRDTTGGAAGRNTSSRARREECTAGIRAVADAGAELILLNPLVDERATARAARGRSDPGAQLSSASRG